MDTRMSLNIAGMQQILQENRNIQYLDSRARGH